MTIAFFKFECCLCENGKIYCKYDIHLADSLRNEILEALENFDSNFPINFILCDIAGLPETWIQLFILRNTSAYEIVRGEDFIIMVQTEMDSDT